MNLTGKRVLITVVNIVILLVLPMMTNASDELEEVIVTGSRIPLQSSEFATPTTVIQNTVFDRSGSTNLGEILHKYPALLGGISNNNNGVLNAGQELLNLRGLGTARTLVLVDGKRQVPGQIGTSAVDISYIPTTLVERVEIITGGASAIYGADAVTGVVNVLLKKDFEGLEIDLLGGVSDKSDGERNDISLLWGMNFNGGRGNITVSVSYTDESEVIAPDRSYSNQWNVFVPNPANTGPADGIDDQLFITNARLRVFNLQGTLHLVNNAQHPFLPMQEVAFSLPLFPGDPIGLSQNPVLGIGLAPGQPLYDSLTRDSATGEYKTFEVGGPCNIVLCQGGDGINLAQFDTIVTPLERTSLSLNTRYDFEKMTLNFAARYSKKESGTRGQIDMVHDNVFGPYLRINRDNPFLPTEWAAEMDARGLTAAPLATLGYGLRIDQEFENWQISLSAEREIWSGAHLEVYAQYGVVEGEWVTPDVLVSRYFQAADAVTDADGNPACRDPSNGCVPYNPFNGTISGAALGFAGTEVKSEGETTQELYGFSINGDLWELPAGTLQYAVGAEYREETSELDIDERVQAVDPATGNGLGLVGVTFGLDPTQHIIFLSEFGEIDVWEAFVETQIPLVTDKKLVKSLDLNLAARYADHNTVGSNTSYKVGVNWTLNDIVRFRTTYSRAVRAPNITELFKPTQRLPQSVTDPCDQFNLTAGPNPANRQANCAALGLPPDFSSLVGASRSVTSTGNTNLSEEEADTLTLGVVFTWKDLSLAIDYWDIEIEDAITEFNATQVVENCVDGEVLDPVFCSLTSRSANGQIANIIVTNINAAEFRGKGVDADLSWSHSFDHGGLLSTHLIASYTDELTFFQSADNPESEDKRIGERRNPRVRGLLITSYSLNNWQLNWDLTYVGSTKFENQAQPEEIPDNRIDAEIYHDINVQYFLSDDIQFHAGILNLEDNRPPLYLNRGGTLYDAIGRYYVLGARFYFN